LAGIMTLPAIEMVDGEKPEKLTSNPDGPAAGVTLTVRVPGEFKSKLSGFGASEIFMSLALMVTVTGALLAVPLFTIS
jgi:hypothetical protein